MPNLNAFKDKLSALKTKLMEKTEKIGFLKRWRERSATETTEAPATQRPGHSYSLGSIYREGSTGTRLQVLAFYVFILVALVSTASLLNKVAGKLRSSDANTQLKKDYTNEFTEARRKVLEKADMISLGQFSATAYVGPPKESMIMSVDLWVRVTDPDAAHAIDTMNEVFRDKTMDALNELFAAKVNFLSEEGKIMARDRIKASLNTALKKGAVEEVFIQNLVLQ
jgi:flagellar basal body-associated protein FliL